MNIIIKNSQGENEVALDVVNRVLNASSFDYISFNLRINHCPFSVSSMIDFSVLDLRLFTESLKKILSFKMDNYSLLSFDRDFEISLKMDRNTGQILYTIDYLAGVRGRLKFEFNSDQSCLPDLIEQMESILQ